MQTGSSIRIKDFNAGPVNRDPLLAEYGSGSGQFLAVSRETGLAFRVAAEHAAQTARIRTILAPAPAAL